MDPVGYVVLFRPSKTDRWTKLRTGSTTSSTKLYSTGAVAWAAAKNSSEFRDGREFMVLPVYGDISWPEDDE